MPAIDEKNVRLPETLTIGGVTYAVKESPELQQFIQSVAKVEKSKLYSQFQTLKNEIDALKSVEVTGASATGNIDTKAIVEVLKGTFVTKEDLQTSVHDVVEEVVQPVLQATEKSRLDELNAYREKLISENIATCIPELVKGDTKEELDASLAESIRLRGSYPTPSTAGLNQQHTVDPLLRQQAQAQGYQAAPQTPTPSAPAPQQPTPQIPSAPRRPSPEVNNQPSVKQMPMGEFAQKRDSLRQQLEAMYGGGGL